VLYHLFNLGVYGTADKIANVVTLSLTIVVPVLLLVAVQRTRVASSSRWSAASP
jgi:hypothetical protein